MTKKEQPKKELKERKGIVVSGRMDKTITISITDFKTHPKYIKKYRSTKRYKVHDEKNEYKIGDEVFFVECRPFSKNKKWKVVKTSS